jgi:hypothetical protein
MNDDNELKFLLDLGFKYRKHISERNSVYYDLEDIISLKISRHAKIDSISKLIKNIKSQVYEQAYADGQKAALTRINNKLNQIVYE